MPVLAAFALLLGASVATADTFAVTSFSVSPQGMIPNGYIATFSWSTNGSGVSILFNCPVGVTVAGYAGGYAACNSRFAVGSGLGSAAYVFTNVSGASKPLSVTVYPKDMNGADYAAGAASFTLTVGTSPQPIINASASPQTVASNASTTITWTGVDAPGANIQLDCVSGLSYQGPYGPFLCGVPAFSSAFPVNGSAAIGFTNSSYFPVNTVAHVMPLIGSGTYDMTHALAVALTIQGKVDAAAPSVSSFTASSTVASGQTTAFSWTTANASGANIELDCDPAALQMVSASSLILCNGNVATTSLTVSGTTTVSFTNKTYSPQTVTAYLLPQGSDGTYYKARSIKLSLTVLGIGASLPASAATVQTPVTVPPGQMTAPVTTASKNNFTLQLARGSRNAQVTALQTFLAQNATLYPEGSVTGFFGPATERAVGRFQQKYGIANPDDQGYGQAGPKTRTKLNSLTTP